MIDLVGTLRRLVTAVAAIPTGAERGTDDATLQATWTDAMATALANYTAARAGYLDELAAGNLPTDISTIDTVVDGIQTDLSNGTDGLGALKALIDAAQVVIDTITPVGPTKAEMDNGHALLATEAKQDIIDTNVDQIEALVATTVVGKPQILMYPDDWDSLAAGSYALVTAVDQDVIIESITFYTARDLSGDAGFTGISFQTDATTPDILISQADGVKANLTAEGQLFRVCAILLKPGTYIEFTVYGGAIAGVPSLVEIVITYKAVVSGGYIA